MGQVKVSHICVVLIDLPTTSNKYRTSIQLCSILELLCPYDFPPTTKSGQWAGILGWKMGISISVYKVSTQTLHNFLH